MAVLLETTLGDLVIDLYTEERPRGTGRRCDGGRGRGAPAAWARPGPAASGLGGAAGRRRYPRGGWKRGDGNGEPGAAFPGAGGRLSPWSIPLQPCVPCPPAPPVSGCAVSCSLPEFPEALQNQVLQLLPHLQCAGEYSQFPLSLYFSWLKFTNTTATSCVFCFVTEGLYYTNWGPHGDRPRR